MTDVHKKRPLPSLARRVLAAALVPVLAAGLAVATAAPAAAYERLKAQQHPVVAGKTASSVPYAPDPDDEAARKPVPAPVWPQPGKAAVRQATTARVGGLPVSVTPVGAAGTASVEVLDRKVAERGSWAVVVRLESNARAEKGHADLSLDYSAFRSAFGADYGNRLRLLSLPPCALDTPADPKCAGTAVSAVNDGRRVSGRVPAGGLVALAAGPEGSSGDFKATELKASGSWEFGGSSGDFSWQYPMRTPPALEGPEPRLRLDYSSQSVDGMTAATNNQPSWAGEGFSFSQGFIERSYRPCTDVGGGVAKTGDLCWASDNAVLSLDGRTTELVRDDVSGTFRARHDAGMRVERRTGAANGDNDGEHWVVTDRHGTEFWFGRNRLPGWTEGRPQTDSTWTVPVYGADPCRTAEQTGPSCSQAWRWNLDHVVDTHGNSMSLWYAKETNKYARNNDATKATDYVRGGWLTRIDYGTRSDSEYGHVPMQVAVETADRCEAGCDTKNATTWKDVPWDLECTGSPCRVASPTFWTTKRLAKLTTTVAGGTGRRAVDSWTLRHSYPDPGDNTRAGLWLDGITHTGHVGGTLGTPETTFTGMARDNRVRAVSDTAPPMKWRRIERIRNGTGGEIVVGYSDPECAVGGSMPAAPETNTLRCFPSYWTRTGDTDPKIDYFHKYVVTSVSEVDHTGGNPVSTTAYEYVGGAAWHHTEDETVPDKYRTWNSWRGYEKVRVTEGTGARTRHSETHYFRGMDGDQLPGGGKRTVRLKDSENVEVPDSPGLEGRAREKRTFSGPGGAEISGEIVDPWMSEPTATDVRGGATVQARFVADGTTRHRIALDGGRGFLRTRTTTEFDKHGLPVAQNDLGDENTADDDQCTRTDYVRDEGRWLIEFPSREQTYALSCDKQPTRDEEIVSDTRTSYDGRDFGLAPTKGDETRTEEISSFAGGARGYTTVSRAGYDAHGRVVESWDARDALTKTVFTPPTGGPVTAVVETNALGHTTTTTVEPAWDEVELSTTDPNGKITSQAHDPLGHLTAVWKPGRVQGKAEPHVKHTYLFRSDAPTAVTTAELHPDDVRYVTSTVLYDGFLRQRQTQGPGSSGRVVSDTVHDSAGRVAKTNSAYPASGAPGTGLFVALQDNGIPNQVLTTFDAADRPVSQVVKSYDKEHSTTTTAYGGDRVDVTPPKGGTATSTITDGRDRKVELRQYRGGTPTGPYDSTKYTYTRKNLEATVVDPAGNTWSYGYDLRGRRTSTTDPDSGTTKSTYNTAGDELTTTDAKGRVLTTTYDVLGRRTALHEGAVKRTEWTYDDKQDGHLDASIRHQDGKTYTSEVTGYDNHYQPTGTKITIPETAGTPAGKLAGVYEFKNSYRANGQLVTSTYPQVGELPTEVVEYGYDDLGKPSVLKSKLGTGPVTTYVAATQYTNLGQTGVHTFATGTTGKLMETQYTYEPTGRLTQALTTKESGAPVVSDLHQDYDPAGNVTRITEAASADTQCFTYDHNQRMTGAWTPKSGDCAATPSTAGLGGPAPYWQNFDYDAVGNRTRRVRHATPTGDVTTTYTYPAAKTAKPHALTSTTTTDNTGTRTDGYAYDELGNTTSRPGEQKMTWDVEGNLVSTADRTGTTTYVDDAEGNRIVRADPAGTTLFLSDTQVRFDRATGKVDGIRFYEHGGAIVAQRTIAGVTWLVTDTQGTAHTAVTEKTQEVVQRRQTPFGEVRGQAAAWPNDHGFQMGAREPGGLVNVGVRQYDPDTGRFTSVDPVLDADNPQQLNAYAYANNSPASFSDPTGKLWGMAFSMARFAYNKVAKSNARAAAQRATMARHVKRIKSIQAAKRVHSRTKAKVAVAEARRVRAIVQKSAYEADYRAYRERMKPLNSEFGDIIGSWLITREAMAATAISGPMAALVAHPLITTGVAVAFTGMGTLKAFGRTPLEWASYGPSQGARWLLNEGVTPAVWHFAQGARITGKAIGRTVRHGANVVRAGAETLGRGFTISANAVADALTLPLMAGGGGSPAGLGGIRDSRDVGGRQPGPR
ncbi:RHS repeat-associated core domain-containing protein [Amycolatopsis sp. WAC 04169]|uniref:RHS repeat domain-containing protein n=1 Tax=Amycolatopsis sp. WAC 04169 TaxID=2203197 RepID=UPI000F78CE28|nr:RHS repeat-associated core domain-containing protein [Amycolatopsis sp. WAC 04169]